MSSKRTAALSVVLTAVCLISAAMSYLVWDVRGICADSALPAAVAVLSLLCVIILVRNDRICERERQLSEREICLKMVSGPTERKKHTVEGKMPNEKD